MIFNPLAFGAPALLALYAFALAASLGLSWFAGHRLRPAGRSQTVLDPDILAPLAGGPDRLTETAIARLLANGVFTVKGRSFGKTGQGASAWSPVLSIRRCWPCRCRRAGPICATRQGRKRHACAGRSKGGG
jgi:uncharacterized protein (TIGR04222 family)